MSRQFMGRSRYEPTGYQMIKSAKITNFRCFKSITLPNCRRINVVVGKNASGKTAILEALFLAVGPSPEIAHRLRNWRGYEAQVGGTFEQVDETIWSDLFFRYDTTQNIKIQLKGTGLHNRALNIDWHQREPFVSTEDDATTRLDSAIQFVWDRSDKQKVVCRPVFTGKGYQFPNSERDVVPCSFFASSHPYQNAESVRRYSTLSTERRETPVEEAIKHAFPFVREIDLQAHGGVPMLHADIPWLPRKQPLSAISSGVNKFAILLLGIAQQQKSVILVDEIENGFHYSIYQTVWSALHEFAVANDAQIFASTHSDECLRALADISDKKPNDFSLIRTEMSDGDFEVEQFVGVGAVKFGEVR